jgi:A/G-specific adenine glycosylase
MMIRRKLLRWYDRHARELPWRGESDPYRVWISEVMLQQTRVETVIPYYERWLVIFPTLFDLAQAKEQDVLKVWEGLGYYSRARNLLNAARIIQNERGGKFPQEMSELKKLPGIGSYIAGAIASIAFGQKMPALDGNGKRVLARLSSLREPVNLDKNARILEKKLMELLPDKRAGDFNQAIMDLGSRICLPRRPKCGECPLQSLCEAYAQGAQLEIPVRTSKRPIPHYQVVAAIIREQDRVLIDQRKSGDLLGGMWEFPGGKVEKGESLADAIVREIHEELNLVIRAGNLLNVYEHAYTHFSVEVHAIECEIVAGKPQPLEADAIAWVPIKRLDDYPMGKVDRLISRQLQSAL